MAIQRMDHVGVIVEDLDAAIAFFEALGMKSLGKMKNGGELVDRILGLEGTETEFAFVQTPDGHGQLELIRYDAPAAVGDAHAPNNALGLRHLTFAVDDIEATFESVREHGAELIGEIVNYEDVYKLAFIEGPEGIIVELAEKLG